MDPVVKTRWRGIGFCIVVVFSLTLPLMLGWCSAWSERDAFDEMPNSNHGSPYSYIGKQIYDETTPVDIVMVGDSQLWTGLNALILQEELEKILRRKVSVISLAHGFGGLCHSHSYCTPPATHRAS